MIEAPALKPCPFCGNSAEYLEMEDDEGRFIAIQCTSCGCGSGKHYPLKDDARPNAANEWNRRAQTETHVVAHITKAGLRNWIKGTHAEAHVLLRDGGALRTPLYAHVNEIDQ